MVFLKQGCQHNTNPTSIKAKESLVSQDFLGAVKAVLVHELSYEGSSGALVLHAGLDQVYGVHSCGPSGYKHTHRLNCIRTNDIYHPFKPAKPVHLKRPWKTVFLLF